MSEHLGYYSQPSICKTNIVFVSDDDLWSVSSSGGDARRLTANVGVAKQPKISPDGKSIAYIGTDRGQAGLYVMAADGGESQQLINFNVTNLIGWKNNTTILFSSFWQIFRVPETFEYDLLAKKYRKLDLGEALFCGYGKNGAMMIGRKNRDPARWKRYKGGTAGVIWTRKSGKEKFQRILKNIKTNISTPLLLESQIYFISDHEGCANVYRCELDGKALRRLTHHEDYYVRNLESDGIHLVYQKGAEIYCYNLQTEQEFKVEIRCSTPAVQAQPRFENAEDYLESYAISPNLQELFVGARGHGFSMPVFDGPVFEWDLLRDIRYKHPTYSHDGNYLYLIGNNSQLADRLIQCDLKTRKLRVIAEKQDWGVIRSQLANPKKDLLAVTNNRNETFVVDTKTHKVTRIEKSEVFRAIDLVWSPEGRYLAYTTSSSDSFKFEIHIYDSKKKKAQTLLKSLGMDRSPAFSADGQYLYFVSVREFYPVYNATHFDLGFPFAEKPYVVALTKKASNPFKEGLRNLADPREESNKESTKKKTEKSIEDVEIEFDGIDDRIMSFPLELKTYDSISAIPGGVLYGASDVKPDSDFSSWSQEGDRALYTFKFEDNKEELWAEDVQSFTVCGEGKYVLYSTKSKSLRMAPTASKPSKERGIGKKDGWIDLGRIRLHIDPREEWKQMYREAWYLQKEHFWRADMSKVDWDRTYKTYLPLLGRVKTRGEFSDLMWEMQGDLGTSHAYEMGGQYYRQPKKNILGYLGAALEFQEKSKTYKIVRIYKGDSWLAGVSSPLLAPGVQLREGDEILKIHGHGFNQAMDLEARLVNYDKREVLLTVKRKGQKEPQDVVVKTLIQQGDLIYRDWVSANREFVHQQSKGQIGYVHIPDMGRRGYAEFYRSYLTEHNHDGLIVDVRFNGGGHVSQHLLKILAQKPIGLGESRYSIREPYPYYAIRGPIVAVTNEFAGSDGDIFSHGFKLMKIGKLIGKRTWGGVIGINGQYSLRDKTIVTQPEFSHWFQDVGWDVENYGTDPDIEVEYAPEDYQAGRDPQLLRAIEEVQKDLRKKAAFNPQIKEYPNLAAPKLSKPRKGR